MDRIVKDNLAFAKSRSNTEFLKDTFKYILVIVVVLFIVIYIVSLAQVVGPSMSPTYNDDDINTK